MEINYRSGRHTRPAGHTDRIFTEKDVGIHVELMIESPRANVAPALVRLLLEEVNLTNDSIRVSWAPSPN